MAAPWDICFSAVAAEVPFHKDFRCYGATQPRASRTASSSGVGFRDGRPFRLWMKSISRRMSRSGMPAIIERLNEMKRLGAEQEAAKKPAKKAGKAKGSTKSAGAAGREKVHEVRVWDEAAAVSPEMQRMPASIRVADIEAAVEALGGYRVAKSAVSMRR
jgi:hypothetical protein